MGTNFHVEYSAMKPALTVEQNGKPVSQYSQFSHCNNNPFWHWYKEFPDHCFHEANGMYSVHFAGGLILKTIFEKELCAQNGCTGFSSEPELITGADRMHIVEDLLRYSGLRAKKLEIAVSSDKAQYFEGLKRLVGNAGTLQYFGLKELPIYFRFDNAVRNSSDIIILSSLEEYYQITGRGGSRLPRLAVVVKSGTSRFLDEVNGCFLFSSELGEIHKLIEAWISDVLFPDYALSIVRDLKNCRNWNTIDHQTALKMTDVLYDNRPYLELYVSDQIELSSVGKYKLTKFPKDIPCRMYTGDARVALLGQGGVIKPTGEGSTEIVAEVKGHPSIRTSRRISVFKYKKVQRIHLSTATADVIVGDQLTVKVELIPKDAHNASQGQWEIIPAGSMKMVSKSSGVFEALRPGRCEIAYTVGNVQGRLSVQVSAKPRSISFTDKALSVKLSDTTQRLSPAVYPQGAKGGTIKYRISNAGVLDFDPNNGQIIPKQEGNCVITAVLLDSKGAIIDDCNCNVTILPPKDVVTPDGGLVLLIVSLAGCLLLMNFEFRFLFGISGFIGALWYSYKEKTKKGYIISVSVFALIMLIICAGGKI